MASHRITRRQFLIGGAATVGAALTGACASERTTLEPSPTMDWRPVQVTPPEPTARPTPSLGPVQPGHVMRIAHLSDMHARPEPMAMDGFAKALRHAQALTPRPDLLLNTGDCVMDSLSVGKEDTLAQWEAFHSVLGAECTLPVVHCIGNHDVWAWGLDDPSLQTDRLYGKAMALKQLDLAAPHFSYDQAGWHFVVLDSTHPPMIPNSGYPYTGKLDEEQYLWLEDDLRAKPLEVPVCVVSHIPILAACEYFDGPNEESGNWVVPGAWMHIDARRMRSLFLQHPNVRLCLSGHTHQHERLDYLGVKYLTNGAVSANWWAGDYMDFPPAYVVVDLFADGTSTHTFMEYDAA